MLNTCKDKSPGNIETSLKYSFRLPLSCFCSSMSLYLIEDAGVLCREYILRIPSVSYKATKGVPLYSHGRWYGVKQQPHLTLPNLTLMWPMFLFFLLFSYSSFTSSMCFRTSCYGVGSPTVGPTPSFRLHIYVPSHIWLKYRWMWR